MYICDLCPYKTPRKARYDIHCESSRHQRNINSKTDNGYKEMHDQIKKLSNKIDNLQSSTQPIVNNINIYISGTYFNDNLNYYLELVKKMGADEAHHYLLHSLGKNPFDTLKKIYTEGTLPILRDDDKFVICRSETDYDIDPTGDMVDKENKEKLDNAVIMASTNANDPSARIEISRKRVKVMAHPKKYRDELDSVSKIIVIPILKNPSIQIDKQIGNPD